MENRLSKNLISLMEAHQIGGAQLARATNIPLSTIKNIRTGGHVNPTIETIIPLARYFDVSIDDIIDADLTIDDKKKQKVLPHVVPVITWEEAVLWPANILSGQYIFTEKSCKEAFALSVEQSLSEIFQPQGILIIDPTQKPNHLDYVLVHKVGLGRASIRQFISDDDCCYLKSLVISNHLVECNQDYRVLGVILEYRQFFKSNHGEKISNDLVPRKKLMN